MSDTDLARGRPAAFTPTEASTIVFVDPLTVRPLVDPRLDARGHDPRSTYVETFWLPIVGPSTVLALRYLARVLEEEPHGTAVDLDIMSRSLGLGRHRSKNSGLTRTLRRLCQFGLGRSDGVTLLVRRRVPNLAHHHVRRLPERLREAHATA